MALVRTLVWHGHNVFPLTPAPITDCRARVRIFDAVDASAIIEGMQEFREVDLAFAAGTAIETSIKDVQDKILARLAVLYPTAGIVRPIAGQTGLNRTLVYHSHDVFPLTPGPLTNCRVLVRIFNAGTGADALEGIQEFRELDMPIPPTTAVETSIKDVQDKILARLNVLYPSKNIIRPANP
jgi:hypothetical protein